MLHKTLVALVYSVYTSTRLHGIKCPPPPSPQNPQAPSWRMLADKTLILIILRDCSARVCLVWAPICAYVSYALKCVSLLWLTWLAANTQTVLVLRPLTDQQCRDCNISVCAWLLFHGSWFVVCRCVHCRFAAGDTLCQHSTGITKTHTLLSHMHKTLYPYCYPEVHSNPLCRHSRKHTTHILKSQAITLASHTLLNCLSLCLSFRHW
jgi:hypothetical protein